MHAVRIMKRVAVFRTMGRGFRDQEWCHGQAKGKGIFDDGGYRIDVLVTVESGKGGKTMKKGRRIHELLMTVVGFVVVAVVFMGCAGPRVTLTKEALAASGPTKPQASPEYRIQPGDQMDVKFFFNPELNEVVFVRPDGKISLQLVDDVQAAGLTPVELDTVLTEKYGKELRKPVISVIVKGFKGQRVYVGGEVVRGGLIELTPGMTALQAIMQAESILNTAKLDGVIVIRKGPDNQPVPMRVDLAKAIDGDPSEDIQLQPYDIVYVPKTWIAKANLFVKQYIADLFLYRGISLGYSLGRLGDN